MKPLVKSLDRIGTESAFVVLARARALERQGKKVLHFEIGEPDFPTADNIRAAAKRALDEGWTHYVPAQGIPELREAICDTMQRTRGFRPDPAQVVVTPGAKPIMYYTMLALIEKGDEVVLPDPGFPIYGSLVNYLGGKVKAVALKEENGFRMTPEDIQERVTKKTKLIIINSPHNPTGAVLTEQDVKGIADIAEDNDLWLLTDEVYGEILYEGKHFSPAVRDRCLERTILLDGFSKTYAMTGWRLGYGVLPKALAEKFVTLLINSVSCTAAFAQRAAVEALKGPQDSVRKMVEEFRARRDLIVDGLNSVPGFRCLRPKGAFYVFPSVKGTGLPSLKCQDMLLDNLGIATLTGAAFGKAGEGFLRFSYASSQENIKAAVSILQNHFKQKAG